MSFTLPVNLGTKRHSVPAPRNGWHDIRDPHCYQQIHGVAKTLHQDPSLGINAAIKSLKQLRGHHNRYTVTLGHLAKLLGPQSTELLKTTQTQHTTDLDAIVLAIHTSILTNNRSNEQDKLTLELLAQNQTDLTQTPSFVNTYLTLSLGAGHPADERYTAFNIAYEQYPDSPHEAHSLLNTLRPVWGGNIRRLHSFAHDVSTAAKPGSPIKSVVPAALLWSRQPVGDHDRHWNRKAQRHLEAALVSASQDTLEHWQNYDDPTWHEIHQLYATTMHSLGYSTEAREHLKHAGPQVYRYLNAHISNRQYLKMCNRLRIHYAPTSSAS